MNKIYTDPTRCDHEEMNDTVNKVVRLDSSPAYLASDERLTELALVKSLKLHLRTASLFDKLL